VSAQPAGTAAIVPEPTPPAPHAASPDRPTILVAKGAAHDLDAVTEHFADQAMVGMAELSTPEQVAKATAGADAVVVALQPLSAALIAAMDQRVRVIGRMGIGLDTVDLQAAAEHGITVFNEPTFGVPEVATHAVAMLLALARGLLPADQFARNGWRKGAPSPLGSVRPLDEVAVGIIGYGRIGQAVAGLLAPMVDTVLVYDPLLAPGDLTPGDGALPACPVRVTDLDELLTRSHVVTVHAPLTPQTRNILGRRELEMLPPGALVVNVSRGGQLDEAALADLLTSGHLGGAGLDVFGTEPLPGDSPLLGAPNTVFSPHCAGFSDRSAWRLDAWTVGDAIAWLRTGQPRHGSVVVAGTR
jgi:D-3-phosphoglycerate dehydrogenase / 2-oxoglutarate reductase